ncbi:MAG: hypothetical protein WCI37_02510 [bacterium]
MINKNKMKKPNIVLVFLSILVIIQFIFIGIGWMKINQGKELSNTYFDRVNNLSEGASYQPVTVSPINGLIYLPQMRLSIPDSVLGDQLVYNAYKSYVTGSYKTPTGQVDEASISTFSLSGSAQSQSQLSCSSLVRIKFETDPNPYNPNEIPKGSVKLTNNQTLQIYAYHNNACQKEWVFNQVNSDSVAALFTQAKIY